GWPWPGRPGRADGSGTRRMPVPAVVDVGAEGAGTRVVRAVRACEAQVAVAVVAARVDAEQVLHRTQERVVVVVAGPRTGERGAGVRGVEGLAGHRVVDRPRPHERREDERADPAAAGPGL